MNRMALVRLIAAASAPSRPDASPGERRGAVPSLAPGVSIIVPLLGGARSLESSLRSLLALEHPGTEILVIDDGRDAASRETIGSLAASSDGRLRAFRRVGATRSEALNLGLRIARHPLVLCIDAGSTLARLDTATPGRFHETGAAALFGVDGAWRASRPGRPVSPRGPRRRRRLQRGRGRPCGRCRARGAVGRGGSRGRVRPVAERRRRWIGRAARAVPAALRVESRGGASVATSAPFRCERAGERWRSGAHVRRRRISRAPRAGGAPRRP